MRSEGVRRALEIFEEVAAQPASRRASLLAELCAGQDDLQARVERMLTEDDTNNQAASALSMGDGANLLAAMCFGPGPRPVQVNEYLIAEELGRGGMGVVYAAEQREPARRIAIKLLRSYLDRDESLRRFRREAQTLGRFSHPNIATVFEAGVGHVEFEDGSAGTAPFIAMELVLGVPLGRFVEQNAPSIRERLELFASVCDAVAHAHAEGITHRDLKPDNVLVDQHGRPKVLDFGVARTNESDASGSTLQTEAGQLIGTAAYMSPEQASGDPSLAGPRSDVYALGVMLHELLAGEPPLDLRGLHIVDALRIITEKQPVSLGSIDRRFRGDLETIVAKALEKQPHRRYLTAADVAADVRRHLNNRPIIARPPTKLYELSRFVRRNRTLVGGIAAVFVVLVAGVVGTTTGLRRALATQNELQRANENLEQVAEFQADILEDLDPADFGARLLEQVRVEYAGALGAAADSPQDAARVIQRFNEMLADVNATNVARDVLKSEIVEPAADRVDSDFVTEPLVQAELRLALARMYIRLGLYDETAAQAVDARELYIDLGEAQSLPALQAAGLLGNAHRNAGRLAEAELYFREAAAGYETATLRDSAGRFLTLNNLGDLLRRTGRPEEALEQFREVIQTADSDRHRERLLSARNNAAVILMERGDLEGALEEFKAVRALRLEEPGNEQILATDNNIMAVLFRLGRIDEAEPYARDLIGITARQRGSDHPHTLRAENNLARILIDTARFDEALAILDPLHAKATRVLPPLSEIRLTVTANLIDTLIMLGRFDDAREYAETLLVSRRLVKPANTFQVSQTLEQLGICLIELERFDDAYVALDECVRIREAINTDHWLTHWARHLRGVSRLGVDVGPDGESATRQTIDQAANSLRERRGDVTPTRRDWIFGWVERWSFAEARDRPDRP